MTGITRTGQPVRLAEVAPRDLWQALVAMPGAFSPAGENIAFGHRIDEAAELGYAVCCTEWNWNGWGGKGVPVDIRHAAALGAAGFLHGLIRDGDRISMATQSMLVGSVWGVTAIRVDPTGRVAPRLFPTGLVTALYARYHGSRRYPLRHEPLPTYDQPYRFPWGDDTPGPTVAFLDAVATGDDRTLYLHLINRDFDEPRRVTVDVSAFHQAETPAVQHLLLGGNAPDGSTVGLHLEDVELTNEGGAISVDLPARSVSVVEIALAHEPPAPPK